MVAHVFTAVGPFLKKSSLDSFEVKLKSTLNVFLLFTNVKIGHIRVST